ncbi:hypothetical protein A2662_02385 [Candidatus Giovannonibacteria bacterium RIFCSPHIGHO2_01_FULL_45_33]|nr:MAG: hypothetical protein A2662_02385 [Candidatus Giovannonibacteria bacterium RIFCSPHIGHO2_01_FULL_45_33]OGF71033.1 MAG: hypothetical protein A3C73_00290 [Candidatus Giovannonibacteria bacterium RIFCSPHIGHO2_02_FULL_44_11]
MQFPFFSINFNILSNIGRPGDLADILSLYVLKIVMRSFSAKRKSSFSCESIDKICLSSASLDFLQ